MYIVHKCVIYLKCYEEMLNNVRYFSNLCHFFNTFFSFSSKRRGESSFHFEYLHKYPIYKVPELFKGSSWN